MLLGLSHSHKMTAVKKLIVIILLKEHLSHLTNMKRRTQGALLHDASGQRTGSLLDRIPASKESSMDEDDHRYLHNDVDAPHMAELDGTTMPWSLAVVTGGLLRCSPFDLAIA